MGCALFIAALRRLWGLLPLCGVYEVYCRFAAFMGCALFIAAARRLWRFLSLRKIESIDIIG
jgi:hypothetical protein